MLLYYMSVYDCFGYGFVGGMVFFGMRRMESGEVIGVVEKGFFL